MKRSEMVKRIVSILRGCYPQHLDNQSNFSVRIDAEYILAAIELEGMLPPYNENHGHSNYDIAMGLSTKATHNWEPEDQSFNNEGDEHGN